MSTNTSTDAIARAVLDLLLPELQKLLTTPTRKLLNEDETEAACGFGRGTFRYYRNYKPELAPPGVRIGKRMKYDLDEVQAHFAKVGNPSSLPRLTPLPKPRSADDNKSRRSGEPVAVTLPEPKCADDFAKVAKPGRRRFVKREARA